MKASMGLCLALILLAAVPAAAQTTNTAAGNQNAASNETAQEKPKTEKKSPTQHARSGARIYKENGKTCSGLDEYKVCW